MNEQKNVWCGGDGSDRFVRGAGQVDEGQQGQARCRRLLHHVVWAVQNDSSQVWVSRRGVPWLNLRQGEGMQKNYRDEENGK